MGEFKTKLGDGGRLVIPAKYRKALDLKPGDEIVMLLEKNEIRVMGSQQAIKQAQAIVRRYIPEGRSLSDELIQERREEASHG
jgi:AbrB family looped-hinge helix DNA binding protein